MIIDRAWVQARLVRNAEICLGERPLLLTIPGKEPRDVAVRKHDAAGANRALELLRDEMDYLAGHPAADRKQIEGTLADDTPLSRAVAAYRRKHATPPMPADYDPEKEP